jgi:hypothetical protein
MNKLKNIDKAFYGAQQAGYYYLEYIHQLNTSDLSDSFTNKDIVLFVFRKTICELYNNGDNHNATSIHNIMTLEDESITLTNKEMNMFFSKLDSLNSILLFWSNTQYSYLQRIELFSTFYFKFLECIEKADLAFLYLDALQQHFQFSYEEYTELLRVLLSKTEKTKRSRSGSITEDDKQEWFLLKIHSNKELLHSKITNKNMKELVDWLYSEV